MTLSFLSFSLSLRRARAFRVVARCCCALAGCRSVPRRVHAAAAWVVATFVLPRPGVAAAVFAALVLVFRSPSGGSGCVVFHAGSVCRARALAGAVRARRLVVRRPCAVHFFTAGAGAHLAAGRSARAWRSGGRCAGRARRCRRPGRSVSASGRPPGARGGWVRPAPRSRLLGSPPRRSRGFAVTVGSRRSAPSRSGPGVLGGELRLRLRHRRSRPSRVRVVTSLSGSIATCPLYPSPRARSCDRSRIGSRSRSPVLRDLSRDPPPSRRSPPDRPVAALARLLLAAPLAHPARHSVRSRGALALRACVLPHTLFPTTIVSRATSFFSSRSCTLAPARASLPFLSPSHMLFSSPSPTNPLPSPHTSTPFYPPSPLLIHLPFTTLSSTPPLTSISSYTFTPLIPPPPLPSHLTSSSPPHPLHTSHISHTQHSITHNHPHPTPTLSPQPLSPLTSPPPPPLLPKAFPGFRPPPQRRLTTSRGISRGSARGRFRPV